MRKILVTGGSGFIGIHLVDFLVNKGFEVVNIDIRPPIDSKHLDKWKCISIMELDSLKTLFENFQPNYVIHLAAVTTQDAKSLDVFDVNIEGTRNLLLLSENIQQLNKFIFTSSQYVNSPGIEKYPGQLAKPYGFYGESKLIGEGLTKEILINTPWTIIRPTLIWGPWHEILTPGLWKQIKSRRYVHPFGDESIKAYGYVKNSVWQIFRILMGSIKVTNHEIFYIGDRNIRQVQWVGDFYQEFTGSPLRLVPKFAIFALSELGEFLSKIGFSFPIFRSRYKNMMTSNPIDLTRTINLFGEPPISLESSITETVNWFNSNVGISAKNFQTRKGFFA